MRVVIAGASGVIGIRLVRSLVAEGHVVLGVTRSLAGAERVERAGGEPVVCDVFDEVKLESAVRHAAPDLVMHQLTDLPQDRARVPDYAEANGHIRREGTRALLAAARKSGAARLVAQSVAWNLTGAAGEAVRQLESAVLDYPGLVLRYGQFYGPETYWPDSLPPAPRVHIDRAAELTVMTMLHPPAVLTVVDEGVAEPA